MSLRSTPKPLAGRRGVIVLIAAVAAVYLLLVYGSYQTFTSQVPGGNDFYPRWRGTRALLLEGQDPYSKEVTLQIQMDMYGRPAREDEDQVAFAYPLYVSLMILPFALLPYPLAQACWLSALILAALAALVVILRTLDWNPRPAVLVALALWSVFFYPTARSVMLGQISIVVLAFFVLALWALENRHEAMAGCLLALSTVKPQMVFLIVPFLLLVSARRRAYKMIAAFVGAMIVLALVSLVMLPTWIPSFVAGLGSYQSYTSIYREGRSPLGVIVGYLLPSELVAPVTLLLSVALMGCILYFWIVSRKSRADTYQALFFTMVVSLLLPAQTGTTNQVLLLLPILYTLATFPANRLLHVALPLALLVGPWVLFLLTFPIRNGEHSSVSVALLIATLALMWWTANRAHNEVKSA